MPKVLVFAADLNPRDLGGAEAHLVELLKRLNFEFAVLVGRDTGIQRVLPPSVIVLPVNYPRIKNFMSLLFIVYSLVAGIRFCLRRKVNLVWAKQEFPQGLPAAIVAAIFRLPLYITAQNPRAFSEEMVLSPGWKRLARPLHFLARAAVSWSLSRATVVAAVSRYSAAAARSLGAKNVLVVPNGIDTKLFNGVRAGKKDRWNFVTTSTLIPRNATDTTLLALGKLPSNLDWNFFIAGAGPQEQSLRALARDLGIGQKVSFLGTLDGRGVKKLLAVADIFIRPSRYEGFGVSFLEAMAMGVPVITTQSGGQKDFVRDRETGLIVPVDNPSAVRDAILRLMESPRLRKKMVDEARTAVNSRYSWAKIARRVEKIFRTISIP